MFCIFRDIDYGTNMKSKQTTFVKFTANYHVYYNVGGSLSATVEAKTRPELLKEMDKLRRQNKDIAEVITFEPIKKIIEIKEAKGKFTVFRKVKTFAGHLNPKSLKQFYNEV